MRSAEVVDDKVFVGRCGLSRGRSPEGGTRRCGEPLLFAAIRVLTNRNTGEKKVVGFCRRHGSLHAPMETVKYNFERGRTTWFTEPSILRSRARADGSLEYIHIDD